MMVSVIIDADRRRNAAGIIWPEDSFPIYYEWGASLLQFTHARIIPKATLEQITFLKLSGFVVFESKRHTIETVDGKFMMTSAGPTNFIRTNAV